MDIVKIGAGNADDAVPIEIKVAGEVPTINWLLIGMILTGITVTAIATT